MALQGLSNANDEWCGTAKQELLSITRVGSKCLGWGHQACPRTTWVVSRGQSHWAGSALSFRPPRWAATRAKELRSALLDWAEAHPRICAVPTSETSSVSQVAPEMVSSLDTRLSRDSVHSQSSTCTAATLRSHSCSTVIAQSGIRSSGLLLGWPSKTLLWSRGRWSR